MANEQGGDTTTTPTRAAIVPSLTLDAGHFRNAASVYLGAYIGNGQFAVPAAMVTNEFARLTDPAACQAAFKAFMKAGDETTQRKAEFKDVSASAERAVSLANEGKKVTRTPLLMHVPESDVLQLVGNCHTARAYLDARGDFVWFNDEFLVAVGDPETLKEIPSSSAAYTDGTVMVRALATNMGKPDRAVTAAWNALQTAIATAKRPARTIAEEAAEDLKAAEAIAADVRATVEAKRAAA